MVRNVMTWLLAKNKKGDETMADNLNKALSNTKFQFDQNKVQSKPNKVLTWGAWRVLQQWDREKEREWEWLQLLK